MSDTQHPSVRRRYRRRTIRILVDYYHQQGMACEYATTLGAGGMFIETEQPLALQEPLKVRFRLPGNDTLFEIEGRVVWRQAPDDDAVAAPGMGIEFVDPAGTSRLAHALERVA